MIKPILSNNSRMTNVEAELNEQQPTIDVIELQKTYYSNSFQQMFDGKFVSAYESFSVYIFFPFYSITMRTLLLLSTRCR